MFRTLIALRPAIITLCTILAFAGGIPSTAIAQTMPGVAGELPTLAPELERVTPAVVNISVVSETPATSKSPFENWLNGSLDVAEGFPWRRG